MNSIIKEYLALKIDTKTFVNAILTNEALLNEIRGYLPTESTVTEERWKGFPYMLSLRTHGYDLKRLLKYRFSNGVNPAGKSGLYDFIHKLSCANGYIVEYNEYYKRRFKLLMDIVPNYIGGNDAEEYIDFFISELSTSLTDAQKKKALKQMIQETFLCKGKARPQWVQEPEWPVAEKPLIFVLQTKKGDKDTYVFENSSTDELVEIVQYA